MHNIALDARLLTVLLMTFWFSSLPLQSQEQFRQWLDNERALISKINSDGAEQLVSLNLITGQEKVFRGNPPPEEILYASHGNAQRADGSSITVIGNDLYLVGPDGSDRQLTYDVAEERNPKFSNDQKKVAYTKDNDLYVLDLATNKEKRLTFDGSESVYNGWASWVYYEEILGRSSRYAAFWWSPDNQRIAFLHFNDEPVPTFTLFRSEGQHGDLEVNHYPKAGDPNPEVKFGIVDIENGGMIWVEEDAQKDQYSALPFWTPDGKYLLIQEVNRDQDSLQLVKIDPHSGQRQVIYLETQPTWVEFYEEIDFLVNGDFLLRSNRSGWYNLYRYNQHGKLVNQITNVDWRVLEVLEIDEKNNRIFFYGTGADPTERHLFVAALDGGHLKQLTTEEGWHSVKISPSGNFFHTQYSSLQNPGKAYISNIHGETIKPLDDDGHNPNEVAGVRVESLVVETPDGFKLPGYWVLPKGFNEQRKYPVVFSVYGGPDAGSIKNQYRSYADNFYTNNDIILFELDHRGSGKFGKKGMDFMHRSLGYWEMRDLIEGVKWLREKSFVDSTKIGITGGSYGGYVTAMALTYGADFFTHGVSLFPVTDWHLYDNVYTERYMDRPQDNPNGYRTGSAITHADKYKGHLLIVHGMMDDNVHMQNTMQFIGRLQDLGKDFEMMVYPGERHGWGGPKRSHLSRLTQGFWKKHFLKEERTTKILQP